MKYRKLHLILLAFFSVTAVATFGYVRSQGSTLARHFFGHDLTVTSVAEDTPILEELSDEVLGSVLDETYGTDGAEIVSERFIYSPETREVLYKIKADRECGAKLVFRFHNFGDENLKPAAGRTEQRILDVKDCEYEGNQITCKTQAPDWATGVDGMILLTER